MSNLRLKFDKEKMQHIKQKNHNDLNGKDYILDRVKDEENWSQLVLTEKLNIFDYNIYN